MSEAIPQVGDVIAGKYRVESVLGRGGMGVVFAARHAISERRVAVKWMEADLQNEPDALERFVREARAMGRIEHPNVVGVLDVGTEGAIAYLVMDILRGESLRASMARTPRMPVDRALETLLPALEGVEAAHRAGVVHRDLKPENLFVVHGPDGKAQTTKVLDFGISKLTESESKKREARRLTKTGHVVGTPTYMAPEQVRASTIDARTDVWALATILYEMLSGRTPFDADNFGALLVSIAVEPYTPLDPALVRPDLAKVVHRGLAKEPEDRWQSVLDFARALEPFAKSARFREPRPISIPPATLETARASGVPTVSGGKPVAVSTPELDLPAPRAPAARPASPTPLRIPRASIDETEGPPSGNRRLVAIGAVALVVVIGLVAVIRGIGNAARDAALTGASTLAAPTTVIPPTSVAPDPTTIAVAPPVSEVAPPPSALDDVVVPPPTRVHGHAHAIPPTVATTTAPPPPTTGASRSGSISRDDF